MGSEFEQSMARLGDLIRQLEHTGDPAIRSAAKEAIQCLMDLHGAAVGRILEIVAEKTDGAAIHAIGDDPLTRSLLILYGLHPDPLEARVNQALRNLGSAFRRSGAQVELLGIEETTVRLKITGVKDGASGRGLKQSIEEQIYALAPDVTRVEGLETLGAELVAIAGMPALAGKGGS